ncbi:hypothetical protein [Streptomyces sp. NPDC051677]|uniref:hypothetical protein n=1 Tax=Streptomyces sp. NPDC051677 TaxID=3365669 RepID=UPI0037CCDE54
MSSEARDLRELLEAVCEALTVPGDDVDDRRLADRAIWARTVVRGALDENPADVGWNVGYLRKKLDEEAAGARL